jgi:DNA-directed RNA polymerase subunit K/omega
MLIYRSNRLNVFEFVVVAALRAKQLARGATPRVNGDHEPFITAQLEVLAGKVQKIGDTATSEQSYVRPGSEPIPAKEQENVGHRAVYRDEVSVSGLAGAFSK